ncbi:MAG: beta-Ig-H3/fasciclin [Phycisphaerae bacterium]|nr:beta-Ig-H3/fasciclin [Phycisphaerae bacterium]
MSETLASVVSEKAGDIVDVAASAGDFSTLLAAATAAGLVDTLKSEGPITVFAPTDAAFAKLPAGTVETLLKPENKDTLVAVLTYHVVPGRLESGDVLKKKSLGTVNGQKAAIAMKDGKPKIDGATIVATDIEASNGVIHVIDSVMLPESKTILEVATGAGTFKTLAAALKAADLVEVLQGAGPFTVLAPTDAAFAKLPAGTVESLLKPENKDTLRTILLYHVIPGRVYADTVVTLKGAPTAAGMTAPITVKKGDGKSAPSVMVGGAKVVKTDIDASNGVIHVVDAVILPE